jgi:hypothetical protein
LHLVGCLHYLFFTHILEQALENYPEQYDQILDKSVLENGCILLITYTEI